MLVSECLSETGKTKKKEIVNGRIGDNLPWMLIS